MNKSPVFVIFAAILTVSLGIRTLFTLLVYVCLCFSHIRWLLHVVHKLQTCSLFWQQSISRWAVVDVYKHLSVFLFTWTPLPPKERRSVAVIMHRSTVVFVPSVIMYCMSYTPVVLTQSKIHCHQTPKQSKRGWHLRELLQNTLVTLKDPKHIIGLVTS